MVQKEISL